MPFTDQHTLGFAQHAVRVDGVLQHVRQHQHVDGVGLQRQRVLDAMHVGLDVERMPEIDAHLVRDAARIEQPGDVVTAKLHDVESEQIGQEASPASPTLNVRQQAPRRFPGTRRLKAVREARVAETFIGIYFHQKQTR
jgi:hypothetical protein